MDETYRVEEHTGNSAHPSAEDVIELAIASDMQNVEWSSGDEMTINMKVMASITPVVKSDQSGQSGVAHLSP